MACKRKRTQLADDFDRDTALLLRDQVREIQAKLDALAMIKAEAQRLIDDCQTVERAFRDQRTRTLRPLIDIDARIQMRQDEGWG